MQSSASTRTLSLLICINWNLNLERQLTNTTGLQIAYVGNRGVKLYSVRNINQNQWYDDWVANGMGDPYEDTDGQSGRPFANPTLCGTHCFPYLSDVEMLENHDYSIYHGLQVTLKQRGFKGLDFVAGYTWAHAIDLYGSNRSYDWENPTDPSARAWRCEFRHSSPLHASDDVHDAEG